MKIIVLLIAQIFLVTALAYPEPIGNHNHLRVQLGSWAVRKIDTGKINLGGNSFFMAVIDEGRNGAQCIKLNRDKKRILMQDSGLAIYSYNGKISRVSILPEFYDYKFLRQLLALFFRHFPDIEEAHPDLMDPMTISILMEDYGFRPASRMIATGWIGYSEKKNTICADMDPAIRGRFEKKYPEHSKYIYFSRDAEKGLKRYRAIWPGVQLFNAKAMSERLLRRYFKEGMEFNYALSVFGSIILESAEKRVLLERFLAGMSEHKKGKPFSKEDIRDILEWISPGDVSKSGDLEALLDTDDVFNYSNISDNFLELIVMFRIPLRYSLQAYSAYKDARNSEGKVKISEFRRKYYELIKLRANRGIKRGSISEFLRPVDYNLARGVIKYKEGDIFRFCCDSGAPQKIYFQLKDSEYESMMRLSGHYADFTPYLYFMEIELAEDRLVVTTRQAIVRTSPEIKKEFPEMDKFIRNVPRICLSLLINRADELVNAIWPERYREVRRIQIVTTGQNMYVWPFSNASSIIRDYTDIPLQEGFNIVEIPLEAVKWFHKSGYVYWAWEREIKKASGFDMFSGKETAKNF